MKFFLVVVVVLSIIVTGCVTDPVPWNYARFDPELDHYKESTHIKDHDGRMIYEGDVLLECGEQDRYTVRWEGSKGFVLHHDYNENHEYCNTITQDMMNGDGDMNPGFVVEE